MATTEIIKVVLPTTTSKSAIRDPRLLILYGPPKCGKTTLISTLKNNLILDLEDGSRYVDALSVKIIGWSPPKESTEARENRLLREEYYLTEVGESIIKNGKPYDFVTVDTITKLEEFVGALALKKYKETPMGANFDGTDVLTLDRGAGYYYVRLAFKEALDKIKKLADNIILVGHLKDSILQKKGKDVSCKDLDLIGKLRQITCADADAIGYLYRGSESESIINFKGSEEVLCGSRCPQLKGEEIKIAEYDFEAKDLTNIKWELIYPDKFNSK